MKALSYGGQFVTCWAVYIIELGSFSSPASSKAISQPERHHLRSLPQQLVTMF